MNKLFKFMFLFILTLSSVTLCSNEKNLTNEIQTYEGEKLSSINDFRENSIKGPQQVNINGYKLEISGLVEKPIKYTYDEIKNNFEKDKKVLTLHCVEGWSVKILWEGIKVGDIIKESVINEKANTVIFYAYDGYTTSLPLEYITKNEIMIAYKMNGVILPPERGFPFELVAKGKWGYKWIKWIKKIELSDNENYRGFWESRGYSNTADVNKDPREE